jgi:hypothetical protein
MDIKLNFINRSNQQDFGAVVIFQKNVAAGANPLSVAWLAIQQCGYMDNHPFVFPMVMTVGVHDDEGNYTPTLPADNGQLFQAIDSSSGLRLTNLGNASNSVQVQVRNGLEAGDIDASTYKNGQLLATNAAIAAGQTTAFEFKPTIWIGAVQQAVQGELMDAATMASCDTELSLLGIASADIVMTGSAVAQVFNLDNVVMA